MYDNCEPVQSPSRQNTCHLSTTMSVLLGDHLGKHYAFRWKPIPGLRITMYSDILNEERISIWSENKEFQEYR